MFLEEELEKHDSKADGRNVAHNVSSAMDFPLICKYLLLAGWIASRNPTIDAEFRDRRRRRKAGINEASRLEKQKDAPPSSWRIDKLLSILDHLLAGNEEEELRVDAEPAKKHTGDDELTAFQARFTASEATPAPKATLAPTSTHLHPITAHPNPIAPSQHENFPLSGKDGPESQSLYSIADDISLGGDSDGSISWGDAEGMTVNLEGGAITHNDHFRFTLEDLERDFETSQDLAALEFEFIPDSVHFDSAALFPLLWEAKQGHAGQLEILSQISVLEQIGLFIRSAAATSKTSRGRSDFKCGYDGEFINLIANSINFPLWGFV